MARSYYTYDDDDYLVEIFYDGSVVGSADKMINFERDENGNILSVSDSDPALGAGYHQYQYDAADRVVAASDSHAGVSTVIAYHPLFGPAAVDYSGAFVAGQSFGYDAGGRMIGLSDTQAGAFGYAHTPGGRVDEVSTPNGEVYDYIHDTDGSMRLTGISGPAFTFDISYNAAGDIAGRDLSCPSPCQGGAGGGSSETFAYDDLGRLTSRSVGGVEVENYLYDGSGNRLVANGETWSYSGRNELLARPGFSYGYDRNGNLTRVDEADGGYQTFGWSVDGRMTSFAAYTSLGSLETEASYLYDSSGRRLEKTVDGVTTKFFWEGSRMIAELDGANNPIRRYIYRGYTPQALVDYTGGAVPYYYVTDHLGTPQKLVDQAGTIVWEAAYSAFGEVEYEAGTVTQPLRFPGQYYDSESGLYYNNQRYYDPATGRYISLDPIDGGTNLYAYPTNPLSVVDPRGLFWKEVFDFFGVETDETSAAVADIATGFIPGAGEVADASELALDINKGDYGSAIVSAIGLALPFIGATTIKGIVKGIDASSGFVKGVKKCSRVFRGLEVRGVKDLSHLAESTLLAMKKLGFAAKTESGETIILHHYRQNPEGFLIEIPASRHKISNVSQHPYGSTPGSGLTTEQRTKFDDWRVGYWKNRAAEELARRGL